MIIHKGITIVKFILKRQKKLPPPKGLIGIEGTPQGIAMAYAEYNESKNSKIITQHYALAEGWEAKKTALKEWVQANHLENSECVYVLSSKEYGLNLVDSPNVEAAELSKALKWMVKDFIDFNVEEAVLDAIPIPLARARDNVKIAYLVSAKLSLIQSIENCIEAANLKLKVVDIPELTLRNLVSLTEANKKGCLLLQLNHLGGRVMFCRNSELYIVRNIDLTLDIQDRNSPQLETIALEIQRSIDYCSSLFRVSIANSILLAPSPFNNEIIQEYLKSSMGFTVETLKLEEIIDFKHALEPEEKVSCLMAIGATLRSDNPA
ncbi:MAG: agglutinin biosis protein MshI [Francisellaceae bacterium]|nr:agglutinin biosis protein MshI [Francisellaceae bacterium]